MAERLQTAEGVSDAEAFRLVALRVVARHAAGTRLAGLIIVAGAMRAIVSVSGMPRR
jgi:hypothetical protein